MFCVHAREVQFRIFDPSSNRPAFHFYSIQRVVKFGSNPPMRPCCQKCSTRSYPVRRSAAPPPTAPSTPLCRDAIGAWGAAAIMAPSKNAKRWKPDTPHQRDRPQRGPAHITALWPNHLATMELRHRRSRVERKMHCVKLLYQRLMVRGFDRQVAEFQARVVFLSAFTVLGTPVAKIAG